MIIRKVLVLAIGVMLLGEGVFAMPKGAKFMNNSDIQLSCNVSPKSVQGYKNFGTDFCEALAAYVTDELAADFHLVSRDEWIKNGRAIQVDVRLNSISGADVTITSGRVSDGTFFEELSTESSLFSSDQPLSPSSSRVLVRGIGMQLGLVR